MTDWPEKGTVIQFVPSKTAKLERSVDAAEVLRRAIAKGYLLSVGPRGGDWVLVRMNDYTKVINALMKAAEDADEVMINLRSGVIDGDLMGSFIIRQMKVVLAVGDDAHNLIEGDMG